MECQHAELSLALPLSLPQIKLIINSQKNLEMLNYQIIQVTPFFQNCLILFNQDSKNAVVVDPGGEVEKITGFLNSKDLNCHEIWLTHSHLDHCGGVADLKKQTKAKVLGHKLESFFRTSVEQAKLMYGISDSDMKNSPEPDQYIDQGEKLMLDENSFEIYFTPGHSPGHLCFFHAESKILVAGDTLFYDSIGRTDLPYGNHNDLIDSIKNKLFKLPDDTIVLPGHGEITTIGREKRFNPFLK